MLHPEEAPRISYHHAPFVIFGAPLNRVPERLQIVGTQMDIMPTIAGAIGIPVRNVALGRNLLDPKQTTGYAFVHRRWGTGSEVLVFDEEFLLAKKLEIESPTLHAYRSRHPIRNMEFENPAKVEAMNNFADGFYDASKFMMLRSRP